MLSTLTNLLFIVVLFGVLAYGMLLSRRVSRLMEALEAMAPLVKEFSQAVDKTEKSVSTLTTAARSAGEEVVREAEALREAVGAAPFTSVRREPIAGMTRLSGKSELVKSFFDRGRRQVDAARPW